MQRREFLLGGIAAGPLLGLPATSLASAPVAAATPGPVPAAAAGGDPLGASLSDLSLDPGWRFFDGDIALPRLIGQDETYDAAKAGHARGPASTDFDDSGWRELSLPHDFVKERTPQPDQNVAQGYRRRGIAWYRRRFRLDESLRGKAIELRFDGVSSHCTVWVNGMEMAHSYSGYNTITVDLTPIAGFGADLNTIAVRVDAQAMDGWWYEGGGIYRHVWLAIRAPLHIATDGLGVVPRQIDGTRWEIPCEVTLANAGEQVANATVQCVLVGPDGRVIDAVSAEASVSALGQQVVATALRVSAPQRWDVDAPVLYRVIATVSDAQGQSDRQQRHVGFRSLRFDADRGFFLNERHLKIKGVCLHQDHAGVGVAVPDAIHEFRMRRLKSLGCNAIRLHHAVAPELLDACDRLGILVMAENRIFNPAPDYAAQLEGMVRRDRHHASVFLWSVLNEEPMQGTTAGYEIARRAVARIHALDDSRPVTAAMNDGMLTTRNVADAVDVVGFNYRQFNYDRVHAARPRTPMLSSEDTSAFQTRGAWFSDDDAHVIAEDDSQAAPWGNTHRESWKLISERDFIAGGFVWTGFDYRGEPTPYEWPSVGSFFGIMDQCGFAKGAYGLRRALWIDDAPVLHLLPHWNWSARKGQSIKVMAFSNAETVELSLNGRSLGRQVVPAERTVTWHVLWEPGVLEAVARKGERVLLRQRIETTGKPVALRLQADRDQMHADGRDAQPITVEAIDAQGRHVPDANLDVRLAITGGTILGVGNGDPNSHAPEQGDRVRLFNGLAQLIVSAQPDAASLSVQAESDGLRTAALAVQLDGDGTVRSLPAENATMVVSGWRRSAVFAHAPKPDLPRRPNDNNTWAFFQPGAIETAADATGYVLYRSSFTPWQGIRAKGGILNLGRCTGNAEVFVDGQHVLSGRAEEFLSLPLSAGEGFRTVAVIIQVRQGAAFGLRDVVTVAYSANARAGARA